MDGRTYVTDYVGDEHLRWENGSRIIISTPTGSGKTTFVVATLLKYAVEQKKHIVYYCNRKILHNQFLVQSKEKIEKFFGNSTEMAKDAVDYLHIFSYQSSELTQNYPTVLVKDENSNNTMILDPEDILYYIFDEAHYFINDAAINSGTNFWYEKKFEHGISVFLTATPKPLMVLFTGWERLSSEENRIVYKDYKRRDNLKNNGEKTVSEIIQAFVFDCGMRVKAEMPDSQMLLDSTIRRHCAPLGKWFGAIERAYKTKDQTCKVYNYSPDYSYVDPVYFENLEEIIPEIRKDIYSDDKWLIFVDDEMKGSNLATRLSHGEKITAAFISSRTAKRKGNAQKVYNCIVENKSFPVKVLVATSALDCGIDIEDETVKNVVIVSDNETTFLQMLGRKRVKSSERIRLFIKVFNYLTIHNRYNQCTRELRFLLKLSLKNEIDLIKSRKSTIYRDRNKYGSILSASDLDSLLDEFILIAKPALIRRVGKQIVSDCNGHVSEKQIEQMMNNELHLMEYGYSKTAFLNLLSRMYDYQCAIFDYRKESEQFINLCAHVYTCLTLVGIPEVSNNLKTFLQLDPRIVIDRERRFPFLAENKLTVTEIDCTSYVERDPMFYLRYQLRWIGKEYDVNCWLGYKEKITALISYLDSVVESDQWLREDDTWHEQYTFARKCMDLILALPVVPTVLQKDKSRYALNLETYPGKNKLEKCFEAMLLPYRIRTLQRRYEGKRKMCWKLCK